MSVRAKVPSPYPTNSRNGKRSTPKDDVILTDHEKTSRGDVAADTVIVMLNEGSPAAVSNIPSTPASSFISADSHASAENETNLPEFAKVCAKAKKEFMNGCVPSYTQAQSLARAILSWLVNDDSVSGSCKLKMMELLACMCGRDTSLDNYILDRGAISMLMELMQKADAPICKQCLGVTATLSTVPDSDSKINRTGITAVIIAVIAKCQADQIVVADAVTCLAVMSMRTRHKMTIKKGNRVAVIVEKLKKFMQMNNVLIAVSRFVATFATKPECRSQLLVNGGIEAFVAAFSQPSISSDPDILAQVCRALWVCCIDEPEVQTCLVLSGFLLKLSMALEDHRGHVELYECGMGVLRRVASQKQFHEEILQLGFVSHIVHAIDIGSEQESDKTDLLKESFGVIGNLAADNWVREQLGENGIVKGIVSALKKCYSREDRKVVKLALASLSNLANSKKNRQYFAECGCVGTVLSVARGTVTSMLPPCLLRATRSGWREVGYLEDHRDDRPVIVRVIVALRRMLIEAEFHEEKKAISTAACSLREVAGVMVRAGRESGHQGLFDIKRAIEDIKDDDSVSRDGCLVILKIIELYPALVPTAMQLMNQLSMDILRIHGGDGAVVDAVSALLAALPLEESMLNNTAPIALFTDLKLAEHSFVIMLNNFIKVVVPLLAGVSSSPSQQPIWIRNLKKYMRGREGGDDFAEHTFNLFDKNKDSVVDLEDQKARKLVLEPERFQYYDKNNDGVLDYNEFLPLARERNIFDVERVSAAIKTGEYPRGHLKPIGGHRDPETDLAVFEGPNPISPEDFWRDFVNTHKPALFKGAYKMWTEEYLLENYGDIALKLEPKLEGRGNTSAYVTMPKSRILLKDFVKDMRTANMYAVSILPQSLAWEVTVPPALLCGSRKEQKVPEGRAKRTGKRTMKHPYPHPTNATWMTHMLEADFWLAYGRTRSQLHYDKEHNFNCLYKGTKKWVMIDTRKHYNDIIWTRGGRFRGEDDLMNAGTDWVPVDPDAVDLLVHKNFENVTYHEFIQEPGDCVYIPYSYLHWVNKTDDGMQVAASYMWDPRAVYDAEACAAAPQGSNIPLGAFDTLWHFDGAGVIPQGYPDPIDMYHQVGSAIDDIGAKTFTFKAMKEFLSRGEADLAQNPKRQKMFYKRFLEYASDKKRGPTHEEMLWPNTPLDLWLQFAAEADPEGMLSCDHGEVYNPRKPEEWQRMEDVISELSNGGEGRSEL
eukprot:gene418-69_t